MPKMIGNWWNSEELRQSRPALILIVAFFVLVFFYKHGLDVISKSDDDYTLNVHTEVFGFALAVLVTVYVIDNLNHRRDDKRREQELKNRLLREVRSPEPVISKHALHEIREWGMLTGEKSILVGQKISGVDWKGADLTFANLKNTHLLRPQLQGVVLDKADFENADLWSPNLDGALCADGATFRNAKLNRASMTNALLQFADFTGASLQASKIENSNLWLTNFRNADLKGITITRSSLLHVSLQGADLLGAKFEEDVSLEHIVLPDGNPMKHKSELERFTKYGPEEPWRSEDPESPAYRESHFSTLLREAKEKPTATVPPQTPPPVAGDAG